MSEDKTFTGFLSRMKARLQTGADAMEGTWTSDNLQAIANELAMIYDQDIDQVLYKAFVSTAPGKYLDLACSDYGITRNAATHATATVHVTGDPGIYRDVAFYARELTFTAAIFEIPDSREVDVTVTCSTAGEIGNVLPDSISKTSALGLKVAQEAAAAGGYDTEDDEGLRRRALERIQDPPTSGNIAHYRMWAKEVAGVEAVRVYDLARGPGTVDVILVADSNTPAPAELCERVAAHIEAVRPIGADVLVAAAEPVEIRVSAKVLVDREDMDAAVIRTQLYDALADYCSSLTQIRAQLVSYMRIASLLFDCDGVIDAPEYTVNGATDSLALASREFPVAMAPEIEVVSHA